MIDTLTVPVPQPEQLRVLAGHRLSPAAAEAVATEPAKIIRQWFENLSPTAVRSYRVALSSFCSWVGVPTAPPETALRMLVEAGCGPAHQMVTKWRDAMLRDGKLAPGTVAGRVVGIASLLKACRRAGLIAWKLEGCAPRAERRQDRAGPRRGDVERLVEAIDDAAATGSVAAVRDAAIVRLLYSAAMRRSEVVGLRFPDDVQLDHPGGAAVNPRRKGKRERELVLVGPGTEAALRRWIEVRGQEPGPLFTGLDRARGSDKRVAKGPKPLTGESVRRLLLVWAKRADITKTVIRPHGLRHSAATETASKGSLATLMALGGWKSMSAAQSYLDKRQDERKAALRITDL